MKTIGLFVVLCLVSASNQLQCEHKTPPIPTSWIDMNNTCVEKIKSHVTEELKASYQYLAMGAYFSRDVVNRPGFAKLFFEAAGEEREHAIKLIEYLLMRGNLASDVSKLINKKALAPATYVWSNGASALRDALQLEASVTKKIRDIIQVCEDNSAYNDYHLVDYLTGDFLTEQYNGQRDLAGKLSTLQKLMDQHGPLGEFLFDKKLL